MQIISDFHDYYDVGMQNGIDPKLPYKRYRCEEEIAFTRTRYQSFGHFHCCADEYAFNFFYIGFAGKIYPVIDSSENSYQSDYIFDTDKFDNVFLLGLLERQMQRRYQKNKYFSFADYQRRYLRREKDRKDTIVRFKESVCTLFEFRNSTELLSLFERFKTAIFVHKLGEHRIVINERLNQFDLQKILPPMQAFQELEMYVGSYLTQPVIEEPPISDKIKAEIHGFDKYSFRKEKTV
jgi:hypothetical protein